MTLLAAAFLGLLIGGVLGALGGGGAILTVPMLVFLLGQSGQEATTSSLVIVGVTAVIGALGHARTRQVRWRTGLAFGAAGIPAAYLGTQANRQVDEHVLLLGFAIVMVLAAAGMLTRRNPSADRRADDATQAPAATSTAVSDGDSTEARARTSTVQLSRTTGSDLRAAAPDRLTTAAKVVAAGLLVGFLTGFFGVGGGFVIVPVLVLGLRFPMPLAVGSSLLVIAVNSAASLIARADHATFDWAVIVPFTVAAVAGTFAGQRLAEQVSGVTLTRSFAVLLLLVSGFVGVHSALALT